MLAQSGSAQSIGPSKSLSKPSAQFAAPPTFSLMLFVGVIVGVPDCVGDDVAVRVAVIVGEVVGVRVGV